MHTLPGSTVWWPADLVMMILKKRTMIQRHATSQSFIIVSGISCPISSRIISATLGFCFVNHWPSTYGNIRHFPPIARVRVVWCNVGVISTDLQGLEMIEDLVRFPDPAGRDPASGISSSDQILPI